MGLGWDPNSHVFHVLGCSEAGALLEQQVSGRETEVAGGSRGEMGRGYGADPNPRLGLESEP